MPPCIQVIRNLNVNGPTPSGDWEGKTAFFLKIVLEREKSVNPPRLKRQL